MKCAAQGATGVWVMLGLVFRWFRLCEFSLLILPRVSSLVVYSLGVSAPTPKAQGLISERTNPSAFISGCDGFLDSGSF